MQQPASQPTGSQQPQQRPGQHAGVQQPVRQPTGDQQPTPQLVGTGIQPRTAASAAEPSGAQALQSTQELQAAQSTPERQRPQSSARAAPSSGGDGDDATEETGTVEQPRDPETGQFLPKDER